MAFIHGKATNVLHNNYDLSSYFNQAAVSRSVAPAETSTFGASAKTYIVGLQDGTLSLSGLFDGAANAVDEEITAILGVNTGGIISIDPAGASFIKGSRVISLTGKLTSYQISAPVGDVVSASADFQADEGIGNSISLRLWSAETASTNTASHDSAASSADGGFGTLHVTANTMNNSSVFKVQHSSDNSVWVDLITFSTVATVTLASQRTTVALGTTVNRYLRATSADSGTGSITYTINFARR